MSYPLQKTIPIMMTLGGIAGLGYYKAVQYKTDESIREIQYKTDESIH